jgi:hypothetical protein
VAAVVLGPALRPGYLLHEDLVTVPRPVLDDDALGLGDRLPRAVPWDGLVAVATRVFPDDVTVQAIALLALAAAGAGAARLSRRAGPGRWIALLVAIWNPFVAEQLGIGHVPHLLGYGATAWVAIGVTGFLDGRPGSWPRLAAACVAGSSTPGGGLLCLGTALAAGTAVVIRPADRVRPTHPCPTHPRTTHPRTTRARPTRARRIVAGCTVALAQAPWVLAGLSHPAGPVPATGATTFTTRAETVLGVVPDVLGLGGLWATGTLPASRRTWLAVASTMLLLGLAGLGLKPVLEAMGTRRRWLAAGAALVAVGYAIALLPHLPGGRRLLLLAVAQVPGGGLLRDGHRWLAWPTLGLAVLAGFGAGAVARTLTRQSLFVHPRASEQVPGRAPGEAAGGPGSGAIGADENAAGRRPGAAQPRNGGLRTGSQASPRSSAVPVLILVASLVVTVLPDLALGLDGRLAPRSYPPDWARVRAALDRTRDHDRVLVLPWQPFRRFPWSGPTPVLDPAPRLLPRPVIVDDVLTVSGVALPAEGPASRTVRTALSRGGLSAGELRALGVGWVLVERKTPGDLPAIPPMTPAVEGPDLLLLRAEKAHPVVVDGVRRTLVTAGHLAYGALALAAALGFVDRLRRSLWPRR